MRSLLAVCTAVLWASTAVAQPASLQGPGWDALRTGDHEQARRAFRRALASQPSDALLHLGLGVATHELGDDVEARRVLTRALALEPRLTPATALLGEIVYASGDLPGAIALYERGLRGPRASAVLKPRLDEWRAEATLHAGFEARDAGRFTLLILKLPRQVDTAKRDWPADEGLGKNVKGGTRPRLSWGRSPL